MIKKLMGAAIAACVLTLAACSGGGGSGGSGGTVPPVVPTQPPVAYSGSMLFIGVESGTKATSFGLRTDAITPSVAATPKPIMVVAPIVTNGWPHAFGGTVYVMASPQPSTSPAVSYSVADNSNVTLSPTPTPQGSSTPAPLPVKGAISAHDAFSDGTPNVQKCGTVTATIGDPVNTAPQIVACTFSAISLECRTPFIVPGSAPAWSWNGSSWVPQQTTIGADVYLSGKGCNIPGFVNPSETIATLHFPGGGTMLSTATCYCDFVATQWTNTQTSVDLQSVNTNIDADGSTNGVMMAKTNGGNNVPISTFKVWPDEVANFFGGSGIYTGAIDVSGHGPDGF